MPRIDDRILNSVFYLYPSVEAAEAGDEVGGTGFRVSVASQMHPDRAHLYAVTNAHVVSPPACASIIRWNSDWQKPRELRVTGNQVVIPIGYNRWVTHPDGDDLAIFPLGSVAGPNYGDESYFSPNCIRSSMLLTREAVDIFDIGPGDDVYMVGRFVHHDGKHLNQPSVRSGIISLMPDQIEVETEVFQEAFLIEMRSISGHSGSPVMWKCPVTTSQLIARLTNTEPIGDERTMKPEADAMPIGPWLVGVDCGAFNFYNDVLDRGKKTELKAKSHAGQSIVIPAWKLQELLNLEEFVMAREYDDEKVTESKRPVP